MTPTSRSDLILFLAGAAGIDANEDGRAVGRKGGRAPLGRRHVPPFRLSALPTIEERDPIATAMAVPIGTYHGQARRANGPAFPGVRLNDAFRVYAGGTYFRKGADRYSGATNADQLSTGTSMESLSFGGGIQYRSVNPSRQLPVEAGLTYSAVYQGTGGFTPKSTTLTMYLRFYYWLWGSRAPAAESPAVP